MLLLTYIVTINYICSSMNPYKTIRLSKSVLSDLKALQKDSESILDTIRRLHNDYLDYIEEITYIYSTPIFVKCLCSLIELLKISNQIEVSCCLTMVLDTISEKSHSI
jgi:hypothetical protein